eukprot:CAMPEP_0114618762 /NCGR_PEP_ID=MMETSP0168-20121206/7864_1 /TAXON_ID=95228 ORGANISM="Vannella sp., Strain DIVA3 517/6/12" /NCGR_SAMPLE_ID=MMETSP0168 /ASSEMBLY_ACC=CAM_ASM_000044 /LENGTH=444 /DNA_ID=CAMNT_0001829907 /DNA_START=13 /DNA_END=1347 /DNA_ORIENTATION=+
MALRAALVLAALVCLAQAQYIPDIGDIPLSGMGSSLSGLALTNWANIDSRVRYEEQSSDIGLRSLLDFRNITYAGTELLLTAEQRAEHPNVVTFPVLGGAVVPRVNLGRGAELDLEPLVLTRETLVNIFIRKIRSWQHPSVAELNPKRVFPTSNITTARRLGRCGTNRVVPAAFSLMSSDWANAFGVVDEWPAQLNPGTLPAATNDKLIATVRVIRFSTGMGSFANVANQFDLKFFSRLINKAGVQVSVSESTIAAALAPAVYNMDTQEIPLDSTLDVDDPGAWPIVAITYIALDTRDTPPQLCEDFAHAVNMFGDAMQREIYAAVANNAQILNPTIRQQVLNILGNVTCNGRQVFDPNDSPTVSTYSPTSASLSPFSYSMMRIPSSFKPPYYDSLGRTIDTSEATPYNVSPYGPRDDSDSDAANFLTPWAALALVVGVCAALL